MKTEDHYCLAIDQGTFSSRAVLFNQYGNTVYSAQQAISLNRLNACKVEQDAAELLASVSYVLEQVFMYSGIDPNFIQTAGLSTQRSSLLAWRPSNGVALTQILSWQDTRAAAWLEKFSRHRYLIQRSTGLYPNPHYGASKIQWLIKNDKAVQAALDQQDCVITPLASYILFNIGDDREINIDIANASRTLLCNLLNSNWDRDLLDLFAIQERILPNCRPVIYGYGKLKHTEIKISAVNGDQTAALYSNGKPDSCSLKINLGTGAFVLATFEQPQLESEKFYRSKLLAGISRNTVDTADYYIEGTVNGAGSAIQWLQETLQLEDIEVFMPLQNYINPGPFIFINSIGGFGSPVWRNDISPCFIDEKNKEVKLSPRQSLVALLESIAFLLVINIQAIVKLKDTIQEIEISGGLSNVDYLCQALASLTGLTVNRSKDTEATARGICWLALPDKSSWKKVSVSKEFHAAENSTLESRFNHFRQYLKEKHGVCLP